MIKHREESEGERSFGVCVWCMLCNCVVEGTCNCIYFGGRTRVLKEYSHM